MEGKEDFFKTLLQKAEPESPSKDFTEMVMENVHVEAAREVSLEKLLSGIQAEKPSPLFEKKIMAQITWANQKEEIPIISRRVWFAVATCLLVVICVSLSLKTEVPIEDTSYFYEKTTSRLIDISGRIGVLPIIYPVALFGLSVLLYADYLIRQRLVRS